MRSSAAPPIDPRTATGIEKDARQLLRKYLSGASALAAKTIGDPIVPIFAHFAELIIDRLNRAPEKNFLAFLDLIGASLLPPQPARVQLTFSLLPGVEMAFVPAGTQVAAQAMPGETEPIVFETEQDLTIEKSADQASPDETPKGTVWAAQYITYLGEVLGSGNGAEGQTVRTRRVPVLPGQRLEVREPDLPTASEQEEEDVRWHEVPDFYASGPRDRHYVIDRLNGVVRFGDGVNGLIPPPGSGNLVMAEYRVGGGAAGNRPAGTITQLRTAVAGIGNVTNADPARGGADAETTERLLDRAPRALRHRGRAVTREDFEDLAIEASPDVARAKCLPLIDLSAAADGKPWTENKPGVLSLIIVPRSTDSAPMPDDELLWRVRDYLAKRSLATAELTVCAPIYVRVSVTSEVVITPSETPQKVKGRIEDALRRFLHPLTGGLDGAGWEFGREPYRSDLYALLQEVPGVDHVRRLSDPKADVPTLIPSVIGFRTRLDGETYLRAVREAKPSFFLVCSGDHDVTCLRASEVSDLHG